MDLPRPCFHRMPRVKISSESVNSGGLVEVTVPLGKGVSPSLLAMMI